MSLLLSLSTYYLKKKITPLKKTNYINCYLFSWQSQEMWQLPAASYNQNSAAALLMIWHQLICCAAFMKDGRDIAKSRSFFLSIGVSIGMKERALFLPDISLTARGYLSVLIRAVAGPVWLLPGCESNHTSSSPLSLIYGGKKTARHGRGSLKGLRQEKMQLKKKRAYFPPPALSLLFANTPRKMEYIRIQAWQPWQTICFSFLKISRGEKNLLFARLQHK